jgi:hypothetical protein
MVAVEAVIIEVLFCNNASIHGLDPKRTPESRFRGRVVPLQMPVEAKVS